MNCLNLGKNLERGINHRKDLEIQKSVSRVLFFTLFFYVSFFLQANNITISLGIFFAYICIAKIAGDVKYVLPINIKVL